MAAAKLFAAMACTCLVLVAGAWLFGRDLDFRPEPEPDPVGLDAPDFASADALVSQLQAGGIPCNEVAAFDPMNGVAPDGPDYPPPEGLRCIAPATDLYVLVYERPADRVEALEHGEVNLNLCSLVHVQEWSSLTGGNWRVAVASTDETALDGLADAVGAGEPEQISCLFE